MSIHAYETLFGVAISCPQVSGEWVYPRSKYCSVLDIPAYITNIGRDIPAHSTKLGRDIPVPTDTTLRDSTHSTLVGGDIPTHNTN